MAGEEDPDLAPLLARLSDNVSELETALQPIVGAHTSASATASSLAEHARALPLLDRAKLYALIVYAIESLLFSYLRLHGVAANTHPVYRELTRVKQYFEKIRHVEAGPDRPAQVLDRSAADRFIRHALTGDVKGSRDAAGDDKDGRKRKLEAGDEERADTRQADQALDKPGVHAKTPKVESDTSASGQGKSKGRAHGKKAKREPS